MKISLRSVSDWVDKVSLLAASLLIFAIFFTSIYGAFFRYILNDPLSWPLPVERILLIWSSLFGIAAAYKRGEHMGMEGLIRLLPPKFEVITRKVSLALVGIFSIVLLWYGFQNFMTNNDRYMISASFQISSKWLVSAIPVTTIVILIHILADAIAAKDAEKPGS